MSTSFIYHAFGAKTYQFLKQEFKGGAIYFHLAGDLLVQVVTVVRPSSVTLQQLLKGNPDVSSDLAK